MKSNEDSITIEETPVGTIPNWLFDHFVNQAIDPRPISNGGPSKILTIYANENSRRQQMSMLSDIGCLLYTSPSPRDRTRSRMPSSA